MTRFGYTDTRANTLFWTFLGISVVVTVVLAMFSGYNHYVLWRDIDSYINRAQVAADAGDMQGYTNAALRNLGLHQATNGHTALIFKSADNDLALEYDALKRVDQRLTAIVTLPHNDTTYQVALDDIRGILRELKNPADGISWVRYWWWSGLIAIVLWLTTAILWYRSDYFF